MPYQYPDAEESTLQGFFEDCHKVAESLATARARRNELHDALGKVTEEITVLEAKAKKQVEMHFASLKFDPVQKC